MKRLVQCLAVALCAVPMLIVFSVGYVMSVVINKEAKY